MLAQASVRAIPCYIMQTSLLPASIYEEADKICRDFIWESSQDCSKRHLVSWEETCKPKNEGGARLSKSPCLKWSLYDEARMENDCSSSKVVGWSYAEKKYACCVQTIPRVVNRSFASLTWKAISSSWHRVAANLLCFIKDGQLGSILERPLSPWCALYSGCCEGRCSFPWN